MDLSKKKKKKDKNGKNSLSQVSKDTSKELKEVTCSLKDNFNLTSALSRHLKRRIPMYIIKKQHVISHEKNRIETKHLLIRCYTISLSDKNFHLNPRKVFKKITTILNPTLQDNLYPAAKLLIPGGSRSLPYA